MIAGDQPSGFAVSESCTICHDGRRRHRGRVRSSGVQCILGVADGAGTYRAVGGVAQGVAVVQPAAPMDSLCVQLSLELYFARHLRYRFPQHMRTQAHTYPPPLLFSTFHRAQCTHAHGTRTYLRPQKQSHHVPMTVLTSGATTPLLQSSPSSSWPALRSVSSAHTSWTALAQWPGRRLQMFSERRRCEASRGLEMAWASGGSRFGR